MGADLLSFRTGHDIAVEVQMTRANHRGLIALVEGPSDELTFTPLLALDVSIVTAHGKPKLLEAMAHLDGQVDGVVAIADADFDRLESATKPSGVFLTDHHDLELMILSSQALERFLATFATAKLGPFLSAAGATTVFEFLVRTCAPLGAVRCASLRNGWVLDFDEVKFKSIVDSATLSVDRGKYVGQLLNKSKTPGLELETALRVADELLSQVDSLAHSELAVGHEAMEIVAAGLRRAFGTKTNFTVEDVEKTLRLAYNCEDFTATKLYRELAEWEEAHVAYAVLRRPESEATP